MLFKLEEANGKSAAWDGLPGFKTKLRRWDFEEQVE